MKHMSPFNDYIKSSERINPERITERSPIVRLTKAVILWSLIALAAWMIWQINTGGQSWPAITCKVLSPS